MTAKRFFIETFGCQMNEHDSEKIAGLLAHRGMIPASTPAEADLFILNTCSVREKAAQKVYSRLGQMKRRKDSERNFLIGVVGCVAQQEGEEMVKRAPFVDLVVGTHMYHSIPDLLDDIEQRHRPGQSPQQVETRFLQDSVPAEVASVQRQSHFRANITIMEGCNKQCSFCIVPFTRGRERNRPARAILQEAKRVVDQGYVEILLLGQTVNSYRDADNPRLRFADLLAAISEIPGLRRLRFTSPHPRAFDDATIALIRESPVLCGHVHLPVQSGSTPILRRMRRQYTREWFLELASRFENGGRRIGLSTDVIVGFPGESEADFEQTLSLVEAVQFESMFSFKYSPRPHTEASHWEDDVPEEEKARRLAALQLLQRTIQLELHRRYYLGQEVEVLVEGNARDRINRQGRTSTNKVVNFPGTFRAGQFTRVQVTAVGPHSLIGQPVEPAV